MRRTMLLLICIIFIFSGCSTKTTDEELAILTDELESTKIEIEMLKNQLKESESSLNVYKENEIDSQNYIESIENRLNDSTEENEWLDKYMKNARIDLHYLYKVFYETIASNMDTNIDEYLYTYQVDNPEEVKVAINSIINDFELPPQPGLWNESDWDKPLIWVYDIKLQESRISDCSDEVLYFSLPYYSIHVHYNEDQELSNYYTYPKDGFNTLYATLEFKDNSWVITYLELYPEIY